jgi:hypothetical protein
LQIYCGVPKLWNSLNRRRSLSRGSRSRFRLRPHPESHAVLCIFIDGALQINLIHVDSAHPALAIHIMQRVAGSPIAGDLVRCAILHVKHRRRVFGIIRNGQSGFRRGLLARARIARLGVVQIRSFVRRSGIKRTLVVTRVAGVIAVVPTIVFIPNPRSVRIGAIIIPVPIRVILWVIPAKSPVAWPSPTKPPIPIRPSPVKPPIPAPA